jgi:hypothetical protein
MLLRLLLYYFMQHAASVPYTSAGNINTFGFMSYQYLWNMYHLAGFNAAMDI